MWAKLSGFISHVSTASIASWIVYIDLLSAVEVGITLTSRLLIYYRIKRRASGLIRSIEGAELLTAGALLLEHQSHTLPKFQSICARISQIYIAERDKELPYSGSSVICLFVLDRFQSM